MPFTIDINHKDKFIEYHHTGEIKKEDIGIAWDELLKIKEFTEQGYNLFSNYSDSKFIGSTHDIDAICDILYQLKPILFGKKQALIQKEARNTALSILFEGKVMKKVGFNVRTFTSDSDAKKWLRT